VLSSHLKLVLILSLKEEINLSRLERAVERRQVPFLRLARALQTLPILIWPCLLVYSAHIKKLRRRDSSLYIHINRFKSASLDDFLLIYIFKEVTRRAAGHKEKF
jgi:hypothetical protein